MDAIIILVITIVIFFRVDKAESQLPANMQNTGSIAELKQSNQSRTAKLNEAFYEDPNAFTEISSLLIVPKR